MADQKKLSDGKVYDTIGGDVPSYTVTRRLNQMEQYILDNTKAQDQYIDQQIESQNSYIQEHAIQGEKGVQALNPIEVTHPYPISEKLTLQVSQFNRTPVMGDTFIYMYTQTGEPEERYAYVATILSVDGTNVTISAPAATDKLLAGPQGPKGEDGTDGRGVSSFVAISHSQEGNETVTNVQVNYTEGAPEILEIHAQNGADGQSGAAKYVDITDVPSTSTQGTLTAQQRAILDESPWDNYIRFYGEKFYPQDIADDRGYRIYTHHGETAAKVETTKMIYLTLATNAWSMAINTSNNKFHIYFQENINVREYADPDSSILFKANLYASINSNKNSLTKDEIDGYFIIVSPYNTESVYFPVTPLHNSNDPNFYVFDYISTDNVLLEGYINKEYINLNKAG